MPRIIPTTTPPARKMALGEACAKFVHRYTMEHVPAWARVQAPNGKFYAPQFRSDAEWYRNTRFAGEPGHFGRAHECYTTGETWPLGEWLDAPHRATRAMVPA